MLLNSGDDNDELPVDHVVVLDVLLQSLLQRGALAQEAVDQDGTLGKASTFGQVNVCSPSCLLTPSSRFI